MQNFGVRLCNKNSKSSKFSSLQGHRKFNDMSLVMRMYDRLHAKVIGVMYLGIPMHDVDEPKVNPRDFLALTTLSIECTCYNDKSVR